MRLERVELAHFRNYKHKVVRLGQVTVVAAPNGAGKTNLLEAIYLLATGESPRAGVTEELIAWGQDIGQVTGIVRSQESYANLTVVLTRGVYLGKKIAKRRYLVDGAPRTKASFVGRAPAVWFRPEDLRLIEGSPSRRRQLLDEILSQSSREYARALTAYERSLRRRNKILWAIREGLARREQLSFWDQALIKNGNILTTYRREFLEAAQEQKMPWGEYQTEYAASGISEARLAQYAAEEVAAGHTLVGPHKDDFVVKSRQGQGQAKDLHKYGSRGEQRLGVLFLKMSSLFYLERAGGEKPLLMLDDLMSELDAGHREQAAQLIGVYQTIVTTAEEQEGVQAELMGGRGAEVVRLED